MTTCSQPLGRRHVALFAALLLPGSATGQAVATHLVFTVQPGPAAVESSIRPAVEVTVQDASGHTVTDFTGIVTLSITDGTGNEEAELSGTLTVQAVAGVAAFADLTLDEIGSGYTLTATAPGLSPATSAPFDITAAAVSATPAPSTPQTPASGIQLVFQVQPHAAAEEASLVPAVEVVATDASGAVVATFTSEVTVSIRAGSGDPEAELTGTTTVRAAGGVAVFSDLAIDNAATGYVLVARAAGAADGQSAPFDITNGDEAATAVATGARKTLRAASHTDGIVLDGRLNEPAWATADSIGDLVTVEPEEGGVPAGRTTVKVLVSPAELVIGVRCRDPEPAAIVSYSKARDADLESEDHVLIVLDPFQDGRSGYVFAVNPAGARFDGLVAAQGEEVNSDWDAVWEARTSRDAEGWSAEIRIPIRSLSFARGLREWGFNIQRRVQRLQESSRWSGASQDYEIYQTSRAGLLTDLPNFDFGVGLSIRPALVGSASRPTPDESRDYTSDVSLDVTQKLGSNLLGSLTINTDFAETEVDARQTNLTRFELLFPEKRSFFLEGSDIFEFGLGLDEDFLVPFFSRRIGVSGEGEDLVQIPLRVGGKINGRIGNTNLGALAVRTGTVDSLGANATMGVVRLSQNVLDESSVGMIATFGDPLGRAGSWMAGLDATYRTSEFRGDKNLLLGVWGLANDREDLDGDKSAVGGRIDYPNDLWDLSLTYVRVGDAFQPSLGFVPRTGQLFEVGGDFGPRPGWSLVRQMFYGVTYYQVTTLGNDWESYRWTLRPLDWQLESGDRVQFTVVPEGEYLTEPFDITEDVIIATGAHRWTRYNLGVALAEKRKISGEVAVSLGGFYEGHLRTVEAVLAVKPLPSLTLELSTERNSATLPEGEFTQDLYGGRLEFKYSSDFQISSFLQYDNESRNFGTNTRLRWTFHPLGDLFLVFNHNLVRNINDRFVFDSNQLLVKVQYAYRL